MSDSFAGNEFLTYVSRQPNFQFLKVIRSYHKCSLGEQQKWHNFLTQIGLDEDDFELYIRLVSPNIDMKDLDNLAVRELYFKIIGIFTESRKRIIEEVKQNEDFQKFALGAKHLADTQRISEIVCEYIYGSLLGIFNDYEVKRISKKVFYLTKK